MKKNNINDENFEDKSKDTLSDATFETSQVEHIRPIEEYQTIIDNLNKEGQFGKILKEILKGYNTKIGKRHFQKIIEAHFGKKFECYRYTLYFVVRTILKKDGKLEKIIKALKDLPIYKDCGDINDKNNDKIGEAFAKKLVEEERIIIQTN